jgi:hypothetical protein
MKTRKMIMTDPNATTRPRRTTVRVVAITAHSFDIQLPSGGHVTATMVKG